ncbi:aspartyl/asparaginyl beta-hydroxylase domain-containing protein [Sphingomonas sp. RT2P30]
MLRQRGEADQARLLLDQAVARFPGDPQAQNARGMRALADGDVALAITSFAAAAKADPGEVALLLNLASAYRAKGDTAGENHTLEAALALDQLHFVAQLRMAELFQRQGQISQAAPHWSAIVQLAAGMEGTPPAVVDATARARAHLAEHNAAYEKALNAEFGGDLPDEQSARRFRACVDHMLGRRKIFQNQCAGVHYPFLPADEFFERGHFPWFAELEAAAPAIRREALALVERGDPAIRPYVRLDSGTPENKWSDLDNSPEWSACFLWEYGVENEAVCALCPETKAALARVPQNNVPGKAPTAFFSLLRPGARIPPHTGVTNTRAIIHLPLVVPDGCRFRVGGATRVWREGEAFAFDDTIEHEAWNDSEELRIVLIFDVWNPHLTSAEQTQLSKLFSVADRGIVAPKG